MFRSVRDAVWAAAFIRDFMAGERPTLFKRLGGEPRVTAQVACERGRRPVQFDLYATPSRSGAARPALVVTHGFTHEGAHDPRLQSLCRRLARLGWIVVTPDFFQMQRYRLGLDDTDDLETVLQALTRRPDIDHAHVGLIAFSFGAAPVLIGLTRDAVRARTSFALIFGGYFDLKRTMRYVLTGAYDAEGLRGRVAQPTHNDDRWKFLKGNVHLIPDSPSRARYVAMLDAKIADAALRVDLSVFSSPEQTLFRLMDNRDPDRFEALYDDAAQYVDGWVQTMSPCCYADLITTRLVILHSETDHKTHFTESLAMSRGLPNAPPPRVAIMNAFAHVDIRVNWRSLRGLTGEVIPGLRRLWGVGLRLVREQSTSGARA
jgi:dienelactone hydrolase